MNDSDSIQLIVITPTRELAMQVSDEVYRLGHHADVSSITICGGQSYSRQIKRIERGCPVLVATPGRLLDLLDELGIDSSKAIIHRTVRERGSGPLHAILRLEGEYMYSRKDNRPCQF